jgi:hypothetical protein
MGIPDQRDRGFFGCFTTELQNLVQELWVEIEVGCHVRLLVWKLTHASL